MVESDLVKCRADQCFLPRAVQICGNQPAVARRVGPVQNRFFMGEDFPLSTSKTTKRSSQCSSPGIIKQPVSTQGLAGPGRGNPQSRPDATAFMFQAQEQVR